MCALPRAGGAEVVPLQGERGVKVDGAEEEAMKTWGELLWGGEPTLSNVNVRTRRFRFFRSGARAEIRLF